MDEITALPLLPADDNGPVFKEPWEAQAFGLVIELHKRGAFSWREWATALSEEIVNAQGKGDPDLGDTYYRHWLCALEKLISDKGLSTTKEIDTRQIRWREAHLSTPHGQPVVLERKPREKDAKPETS